MYGGGGSMGSMGSMGSSGQGMPTSLMGGQSNQGIYFDSSSGLYTDGQGNYYSDPKGEQQVSPASRQTSQGLNYGQQQSSVQTQPVQQEQSVTGQQAGKTQPDLKADNAKEGAKTGNPYMAMGGAATDTAEYVVGKMDYNNSPQKEIDENAEKLSDEEVKQEQMRTGNMRQAYQAPGDADQYININSQIRGKGPIKGLRRVARGLTYDAARGKKTKADDIYNLYTGGYNNLDQMAANDAARYDQQQNFVYGGPMRRWLAARGVIG